MTKLMKTSNRLPARFVAGNLSPAFLTRTLLCLALAAQFGLPALANDFNLGRLVQISGPSPFLGCEPGGPTPPGPTDNVEFEPYVVVNPTNPRNIVAVWTQDRAKGRVAAVSFNGGLNWQEV